MDYKKLISRYKQFGGLKLAWEYAKMGVLLVIAKGVWRFTVQDSWSKYGAFQCGKMLYRDVIQEVEPFLVKKYSTLIQGGGFKTSTNDANIENGHEKVIWWCWLQGIETVPKIVRVCYNSLVHDSWLMGHGYEVRVIDQWNWTKWVTLPEEIVRKWENGKIPAALFSDLLRLELLIEYGGTWIDSTVLCTGNDNENEYQKYLETPLFVFQYTKPGEKWSGNISNWFISATKENRVLMAVRDMLHAYWRDYDVTLDYYMFHLFFAEVAKAFPDDIASMPYGYSVNSLVLLHHWGERFDQKKWDKLTSKVAFHKLNYRVSQQIVNDKENFYNKIISWGEQIC